MEVVEQLLVNIIKGFVEYPDDVKTKISDATDEKGELTFINVRVNQKDIGVTIGKQGETAEALRKIIGLVGFHQLEKRVYIRIDAPSFHHKQ